MLGAICDAAGRAASELTRRDVALALLNKPAEDALADLPVLRRELVAAGNPLSQTFWVGTESVLSSIRAGTATHGDVRAWLEATGTEPIQWMPAEMFVWPDESERGPVAAELHARLVAHLEGLVADGTVDPDQLLAGDAAALEAYRQLQLDWLRTPLPDGRVPEHAVTDEDDEEFLKAWDEAERDARRLLGDLLDDVGPRPCPEADLREVCARLRIELGGDDPWHQLLRAAAGVDPANLPDDDRELWLTLAAGVVAQKEEPPDDLLDGGSLTAWAILDHSDWIAAVVVLARGGPGTAVDVDDLSRDVAAFEFGAIDDEFDPDEGGWFGDDDAMSVEDAALQLSLGLFAPVHLWRVLGAIDEDDRLTELGWWGLPESVLHAWQPPGERSS